uniref:Mitochondrial resolvase Ydc2 catalytic domain-containing protein n=1 Tax=viral metagenome TaxID=1070528 RepID=A0A6C0JPY8_9ZZZZ
MITAFFDLGTENFCHIVFETVDKEKKIINFEITKFKMNKSIYKSITNFFDNLCERYKIDKFYVEQQVSKNKNCCKIQCIIETYLCIKRKKYKTVNAKKKYKAFSFFEKDEYINCKSGQKYRKRKNFVISKGSELLNEYTFDDEMKKKIESLKKEDDFYDCLLMEYTE